MYEVEETVYGYPNLLGVAIIASSISLEDEHKYEEDEEHIYSARTDNNLRKNISVLKNRYCDPKLKEDATILWKALTYA